MSSTPNPILMPVAAELGAALVGLVVSHRGRTMTLSGRPGSWEAITLAEPADVEEHEVSGYGTTVQETLDACAEEADLVENGDNGDADDEEDA